MKSDLEKFESELARENKKILSEGKFEKILEGWNSYLKRLNESCGDKICLDAEKVEIVLVKDRIECNAFVRKVGETYFIALNDYILDFYRTRIEEVFLKYSSYEKFSESIKVFENHTSIGGVYFNPRHKVYHSFFNTPDTKYNTFGNFVFNNILYMIIFHEFGHVLGGHLDSGDGNSTFIESKENPKGNIEEQGKELIADYYGIINTVRTAFVFNTVTLEQLTVVVALLKFSAWCMISFFSLNSYKEEETKFEKYFEKYQGYKHPPLAVRLSFILEQIDSEVKFHLEETFRPSWFISSVPNAKQEFLQSISINSLYLLFLLDEQSSYESYLNYEDVQNSLTLEYYYNLRKAASKINDKYSSLRFVELTIPNDITLKEESELRELKEFEEQQLNMPKFEFNEYLRRANDSLNIGL